FESVVAWRLQAGVTRVDLEAREDNESALSLRRQLDFSADSHNVRGMPGGMASTSTLLRCRCSVTPKGWRDRMESLDDFDRVVNCIYEAALQPESWAAALDAVRAALSCDMFHAFVWDLENDQPTMAWASANASAEMHEHYNTYFGRIDPRRAPADSIEVGQIFVCHEQFDQRFVDRNEFYQEFLIPNGLRFMIGSTLARGDGERANVAMLRAGDRGEFSVDEKRMAARLAPHLRRALEAMLRNADVTGSLAAGDRALDRTGTGIAVLDDAGVVRHANQVARALMRTDSSLRLVAGKLRASHHE